MEQFPPALCQRWFILRLAGIYGPGRHHLLDQLRDGRPTLAPTESMRGKRVLVVDDNATNRRILTHRFSRWETDVEEMPDGESALERLQSARQEGRPFDLAVLDFHMPGIDGLQLAAAIRADSAIRNTALILLSSALTRDHRSLGYPRPFRTVPSGGALYPLELYFHTQGALDAEDGLYHYNPTERPGEIGQIEQTTQAPKPLAMPESQGPTATMNAPAIQRDATGAAFEGSKVMRAATGPAGLNEKWVQSEESRMSHGKALSTTHEVGDEPKNVQVFFSIYFLMTGLHGIHVLAGMALIGWVALRESKGEFGAE